MRTCLTAAVLSGAILCARTTTPQAPAAVLWYRLTPEVVRQDETGPLRIEVAVAPGVDRVVFGYAPNATSPSSPVTATYALNDEGRDGDAEPGDGIFTIELPAPMLVGDLRAADVYNRLAGFLTVSGRSSSSGPAQLSIPVVNDGVPPVEVATLAPDVQASRHVVNILDPGFMAAGDYGRVYRRFYDFFDDEYYGFNVITLPSRFLNRFGGALQPDATGLGLGPSTVNPMTGSGGGLYHVSGFPLLTYFDGAETGTIHELGHQWINYLRAVPALKSGAPHWPVSSLAGGVMGYGIAGGEGLEFQCTVSEERGGLRLARRTDGPAFSDFDLYLMGLLPADQVQDAFVLPDSLASQLCTGSLYTGPYTRVTIQEIIDAVGPRVPAAGDARSRFRMATVVVSRDRLLDADGMAWVDYFAARMELTAPTPVHVGLVRRTGKPFAVATRGLGSIDATVTPRTATDFLVTPSSNRLEVSTADDVRIALRVESRNGAFANPVAFECLASVPTLRPCRFDPPVAVPGASGTDVMVTLPASGFWVANEYPFAVRASAGDRRHTVGITLVKK